MTPEPPAESPESGETPRPGAGPGAPAPPADADYELIRLIGRGGYGEVWLVQDKSGNYHACKVVYRESFPHDRPYEREYHGIRKFEPVSRTNESQINILHVGRRDALGYFYYIMELADDAVSGPIIHPDHYVPRTLRTDLEIQNKLPAEKCIQIGISLAAALENLHRHGLIHRDIKPANIIFVNGVPKLADIGLVTDQDVTVSYVGTEGFIPPEGPGSPRADIYGLGKVLYEISTGKDRLQYPELPANFAEVPDWELLLELNAIVAKACEANPARRYASAKELQADLLSLARGKSIRKKFAEKRRWIFAGRAAFAAVVVALSVPGLRYVLTRPSAAPQVNVVVAKMPAPDAERLAQREAQIKAMYRDEFKNGTPEGKQRVAAQLYNQSLNEPEPAMELASLQLAARLMSGAGDFQRAMAICDRMADRFQMDISPVKADLLSASFAYARTSGARADLAEVCVAAGFQAIADDDYTSAKKIAGLAASASQQSGDDHIVWEAGFLEEEAARDAKAFERVKNLAALLRDHSLDPAANLALGKFLCFVKDDWARGLPMIARGNDRALKNVAEIEIGDPPRSPASQIALGNAWWDLSGSVPAGEKIHYQARARYWYLKGLADSKEPDRTRLRQELSVRLKAVPAESAEVHIFSRVAGTEFIDIYSDQVQWRSSHRGAIGNRINNVKIGDLSEGDLQVIQNTGTTRLMPEAVDFATAALKNDRKAGRRRDHAKLAIFEDHVRVILSHQAAGSAAMDVTVTFGPPAP